MSAIIFDFDGTIANNFDYILDYLTKAAKRPLLVGSERQAMRGRSMIAMARDLGISRLRLLPLFLHGRRAMIKAVDQIDPFEGMPEVVRKLHAEGHELFILSSNNVANLHAFLHDYQLHEYFLEIYGSIGVFGKAPALRKLTREHQLDVADCIYIGDETRDIEAAQSVGMRIIAVEWGYAAKADLKALQPTALAHTPADIITTIEEL